MSDGATYNAGWEMGRKQGLREAADEIARRDAAGADLSKQVMALQAEIERLNAPLTGQCQPKAARAVLDAVRSRMFANEELVTWSDPPYTWKEAVLAALENLDARLRALEPSEARKEYIHKVINQGTLEGK